MKKIDFEYGEDKISILLKQHKIICYENIKEYWLIHRVFAKYLRKIAKSEFEEENCISCSLKIDEGDIGRYDEVFVVNQWFSLEEDLKMGTKSLYLRYLIHKMNDSQMSDEYLQLRSMIQLLGEILSDEEVTLNANEINSKEILKLYAFSKIKEECEVNSLDLTYDELINLQLELIDRSFDNTKQQYILVDIPLLNENIYSKIKECRNSHMIILCKEIDKEIAKESDSLFVKGIDLENETDLYERMMRMTNYYDINEYKNKIIEEYLKEIK